MGYLHLWEINGTDEKDVHVNFYIRYIKNKPEPNLTYIKAEDIVAEFCENMLVLKEGNFLEWRKDWEYNPDQPRNLAKTVTVK